MGLYFEVTDVVRIVQTRQEFGADEDAPWDRPAEESWSGDLTLHA